MSENILSHSSTATRGISEVWRPLACLGAAGPILFLVLATLGGALTPGYNPLTETISAIALGPVGWLQTLNFYVFGASVIAFGLALELRFRGDGRIAASSVLLSISGFSLIIAGIFPAVLVDGQPTPWVLIHGLAFFGTLLPLPGAYALTALRIAEQRGWRGFATYSAALPSAVFFLFTVFGAFGSEADDPLVFISGLLQRLLLVVAFNWNTLLSIRLLNTND
jgi:hypothetical membrane protein